MLSEHDNCPKEIKYVHQQQLDQADCGVACLRSVLLCQGMDLSLEELRQLSGTTRHGTSMLGLQQAAAKMQVRCEGFEAEIDQLKACKDLCILHTEKRGALQHFIVLYGYDKRQNTFLVGDPSYSQPRSIHERTLKTIWRSRRLLRFRLSQNCIKQSPRKDHSGLSWIAQFLKPDYGILSLALCLGVLISVLNLSTAVFSQKLLDSILPSRDITKLLSGLGLLLILLATKAFMEFLRKHSMIVHARSFNTRIIQYFANALLMLPKRFFDSRKTGDLIARMNDTGRIQQTLSHLAGSALIDFLMMLTALTAIIAYNGVLGFVALIWVPLFVGIVLYYRDPILHHQRAVMQAYAMNESHYVDVIQGVEVIKSTNRQRIFTSLTRKIFGWYQHAVFDLGKVGVRLHLFEELIAVGYLICTLAVGSNLVLIGEITTGALVAVLQMSAMLISASVSSAMATIQIEEARTAFLRMREYTSLPSERHRDSAHNNYQITNAHEINIKDLSFAHPGTSGLLKEVSLTVKRGEIRALMGESGCGKSTLLQILLKFYAPDAGSIEVDGIQLSDIDTAHWRSMVGVVPQNIKIFSGTVADNIHLGQAAKFAGDSGEFLQRYGLDRMIDQLPQGPRTIIGEEGINLSGGQQQIIAIARALYNQPSVLLLDEPTAALDSGSERFLVDLLKRLRSEMSILVMTHRLATARHADKIYVMDGGKIQAAGAHSELLTSINKYANAWHDLTNVA